MSRESRAMASPGRSRSQQRLGESRNTAFDERELLHSLNKLTIETSPATIARGRARLSPSPSSTSRSRPTTSRLSPVSPDSRPPSRSPANRSSSRGLGPQSRSATPTLLRKASMNSLHSSNGVAPARALSRRSSSSHLYSPSVARSPLHAYPRDTDDPRDRPVPTAASIAQAYLRKELELLHGPAARNGPETVVVLQDACYGHRFARPRTSKAMLSTIVERPERVQAVVLGLSMAYVRLGERHCDGKHAIYPQLDPTSITDVPFRIHKTERTLPLTSTVVTNVHGAKKWMEELKIMCDSAETKLALDMSELHRPEMNRGSDAGAPEKFHDGDLYLCSESLDAFEGALGAVCEAVDHVFSDSSYKRAFVAVRPPGHHCSATHPSGFCWINNVHVGIMHGILTHGLTHAAIIDFDLHHGDGSQSIAWQHNRRGLPRNVAAWKRTSIGYFSLHDINSFPCEQGDEDKVKNASLCIENAHGQTMWNVHLDAWKTDLEFWKLYRTKYCVILEKARNYLRTQAERYRNSGQVPRAAIFLSAGFDASEWEGEGMQRHKVNVPTGFYARLTRDVVNIASEEGLGVDGRVISVLEGGYSDRALYSGVLSHLSGLAGNESTLPREEVPGGLAHEMGSRIGSYSRRNTLTDSETKFKTAEFPFDPTWWSAPELDRMDATLAAPPPEPVKRIRTSTPGNYSSPTQSSVAKALNPAKFRQSLAGYSPSPVPFSRPPTPPPPDVSWATAAHELSKLLIPKDRQVGSCTFEDLNAEATKARRERQSLLSLADSIDEDSVVQAPVRKSLRERKPARPAPDIEETRTRRKTVGGPPVLATEKAVARGIPAQNGPKLARQPSRQFSGASSLGISDVVGAIQRPKTSLSTRPDTSMSVRTEAPSSSLNIRKTRAPAPPKKEPARAPKKTRPPPTQTDSKPEQVDSATVSEMVVDKPDEAVSMPAPKPPISQSETAAPVAADTTNDFDKITNGMKRIRINVVTKEMKEARAKAEAEKRAAAQKASSPSAKNGTAAPVRTGRVSLESRTTDTSSPDILTSSGSERPKAVSRNPTIPTIRTPRESKPMSPPPSSPVQYSPEDTRTPGPQKKAQTPAASTPSFPLSPGRKGGHGFTSTSDIPFASPPAQEPWSASRDNIPPTLARAPIKADTAGRGV
ncbi:Arginase/deacetylase [Durotheca rogersii]|uniref:Arginase/deacetylase n=1 Tax=Durotheca rogersii TaxID=419775 RepID=UPI00221F0778|nr:Arginase/deacetylase [Durotheca rogersii]KAI5868377.1 Arginase/deacetylase [Durotheca rogersii]